MRFIKKTFSLQSIKLSVICFFCPTAGSKVIIPCSSSNNKRINMLSPVPVLELAATLICHGTACGHPLPHETYTHVQRTPTHTYKITQQVILFFLCAWFMLLLCCSVLQSEPELCPGTCNLHNKSD